MTGTNGTNLSKNAMELYINQYIPIANGFLKEGRVHQANSALERMARESGMPEGLMDFVTAATSTKESTQNLLKRLDGRYNESLEKCTVLDIYNLFSRNANGTDKLKYDSLMKLLMPYKDKKIKDLEEGAKKAQEIVENSFSGKGVTDMAPNALAEADSERMMYARTYERVFKMLEYMQKSIKNSIEEQAKKSEAKTIWDDLGGLSPAG